MNDDVQKVILKKIVCDCEHESNKEHLRRWLESQTLSLIEEVANNENPKITALSQSFSSEHHIIYSLLYICILYTLLAKIY